MHPDLISIGFLHLKTYGAFMALGFLAAWQVVTYLCKLDKRNPEPFSNLLIYMMASGVVGARIAYVIEHWEAEFAGNPAAVIRVDQGGLMFYGGLILAILVFFVWCFAKREKIFSLSDMLVTVIPLGHAFGRIGCFFYGCCYGKICHDGLGVAFPHGSPAWYEQVSKGLIASSAAHSLPVLPTQLFESASLFVLFAALFFLYGRFRKRIPGFVTGAYMIGYAVIRFSLENLRGDPRAAIGPFSIGQTISLGLVLTGLSFILLGIVRQNRSCRST